MSSSWTSLGALSTLQVKGEEIVCISSSIILRSSNRLENSPCSAPSMDEYLQRCSADGVTSFRVCMWVRLLLSSWLERNCDFLMKAFTRLYISWTNRSLPCSLVFSSFISAVISTANAKSAIQCHKFALLLIFSLVWFSILIPVCFQSSATPLPLCTSAPAPPTDAPAFYLLISSLQYICLPVSLALCQIVCVPYLTFQHYSTFPSPAWPPLWITCLIPGPLYRLLPVGYCSLRIDHLAPDLGSVFWIFPSPTPYWFCLLWTDYLISNLALKINQFLCLSRLCFCVVHLGSRLPFCQPWHPVLIWELWDVLAFLFAELSNHCFQLPYSF